VLHIERWRIVWSPVIFIFVLFVNVFRDAGDRKLFYIIKRPGRKPNHSHPSSAI
jgi:hypothetical protein